MMLVDNLFEIGQIVYVKTDVEQYRRIVTRINVSKGNLCYELYRGTECSAHYEFELSAEKDVVITTEH